MRRYEREESVIKVACFGREECMHAQVCACPGFLCGVNFFSLGKTLASQRKDITCPPPQGDLVMMRKSLLLGPRSFVAFPVS